MKFVFFGTPEFSIIVLTRLMKSGFIPSLIITMPDKPAGRGRKLSPPPIKTWAQNNNIPFESSLGGSTAKYYELFIIAAYGKIIPKDYLVLPRYGSINVHPSLLPKYRGPTPIQSAILAGEEETGVSLMLVDEEMDHGNIIQNSKIKIQNKNYSQLEKELAELGGKLLVETIPKWLAGEIKARPQNHSQATFTRKFTTQDAFIAPEIVLGGSTANLAVEPPSAPPSANLTAYRKVLALNPEPGTWTTLETRGQKLETRIKITEAKIQDGKFIPTKVIPAGKRQMSWEEFKRGYHL